MRILHVTKRFWPFQGGVEKYVEDLAAAQAAAGHSVRVLTIDRDLVGGAQARLTQSELYRDVRVVRVPAWGTARKQVAVGRYGLIFRELASADVVHHHDPRFLFETAVLIRTLTGRPLIFHTHGLIWHTAAYARLKRIAMRFYYGPILRRAVDAIVADSRSDAGLLATTSGVEGPKVHLIRNAVSLERYTDTERRPERGLIVHFGRIDTHKGLDRLLAALNSVRVEWRLVVVGAGPRDLVADLEDQASRAGVADRVEWAGYLADDRLADLLSRAWLAVFPSRFEGFGFALLEALASGVPVLASDLPTHREILGAELAGQVVAFDDRAVAAAAVEWALSLTSSEAASLSRRGRDRAALFDLDTVTNAVSALYVELGLERDAASVDSRTEGPVGVSDRAESRPRASGPPRR